jgi:hypothetical protein
LLGSNPTGSALLHACADPVKTPLRVTPGRRKFLSTPLMVLSHCLVKIF